MSLAPVNSLPQEPEGFTMSPGTQIAAVDRMTQQLTGQTLHLPDLLPFYREYGVEISPDYDALSEIVEAKIQEWIDPEDEHVRNKARGVELSAFCALWYPRSSLDQLKTMAWYSMWLFLWDDVVEDSVIPSSAKDNKVDWLHENALRYVKFHLGLSGSDVEPPSPTKYCALFKHCAGPLREFSTEKELTRFYETLEEYMTCVGVESQYVAAKELPTLQEYWEHRLGTSSVHTYCALTEYMTGVRLPENLSSRPEIKSMWYELNRHIVIMNDMVSLKKEMGKSLHSLIPIMVNETHESLDVVIASLVELLHVTAERIDKYAYDLWMLVEEEGSEMFVALETYLMPFWTNMVGSYLWSLTCRRYGVTRYMQQDGSLVIPL